MSEIDELDINPFFKALQNKYLSSYEKAQEECSLICIPQSECLQGVVITEKFVHTHILKPSPFFKGQYRTVRSEKQLVTIEDDGDYIHVQEGFPTKTKIKIISEELGYNKEYKPYKMLIVARPLDHNVLRQSTIDTASSSGEFNLKCSLKVCREYLKSFPEFSKPIKDLDDQIQKFMKSYVILKDYMHEAAQRLNEISTTTSEKCIKSIKDRKLSHQKFRDVVTAAVETHIPGLPKKVKWPVKLVCSDTVTVYCRCDNAYFSVKVESLETFPDERIYERGLALLKKKPKSLAAFKEDVQWATGEQRFISDSGEKNPHHYATEKEELVNADLSKSTVTWPYYKQLCKYAQTRLMSYNKRRSGEVENVTVKNYMNKLQMDDIDEGLIGEITQLERYLMETHDLIQVRGKKGSVVPMLIPPECTSVINFLADREVRSRVGINPKNDYLFPNKVEPLDDEEDAVSVVESDVSMEEVISKKSSICKKLSMKKRQKWTIEEEKEIRKYFQKNLERKITPGKVECMKAKQFSLKAGGSVHQKLYPVLCSKCAAEDGTMLTKCRSLNGLTPDHLGVPKHFSCPVTSAVVELAHLDGLVTPIEKLYCLKTTIDNITEDIDKHARALQPLGVPEEDMPCLTSDELLPILVTVIVQAKCNHIYSDLYYMENFYWSAAHRDKDTLSYCLVTFKASVQYLMSTSFDDIDLKTHGAKHEMSVQELVENRRTTASPNVESPDKYKDRKENTSYVPSKSRYDRQMDNITKMLEDSTKDMGSAKSKPHKQPIIASIFGGQGTSVSPKPEEMAQPEEQNKKEDMGDFLSSLQNDMFLSFGKQT